VRRRERPKTSKVRDGEETGAYGRHEADLEKRSASARRMAKVNASERFRGAEARKTNFDTKLERSSRKPAKPSD